MLAVFGEEKWITVAMLLLFGIGVGMRLFLGAVFQGLIRDTENMAVTKNVFLKQCKTKFIKCFQLNGGVSNVPVFVEKSVSRFMIGPFSHEGLYQLSGQMELLFVVCAGIGICKSIAVGRSLDQILPFYAVCFLGLYLFFSVSAAVDIKGKRELLKINLVDYLENHLAARIGTTQEDLENLGYVARGEHFSIRDPEKMRVMESKERDIKEQDIKEQDIKGQDTREQEATEQNVSEQETWEKNAKGQSEKEQDSNQQYPVCATPHQEWEELIKELLTI